MTNRKASEGAKRPRKTQTKPEVKVHKPTQYPDAKQWASETLSGYLPSELKLAAETINEKALNGLIVGPPNMESANLVCELWDRCVWIIAPPDLAEEKVWKIRITDGPVFNSPGCCEVMRWPQQTTSAAAYHQGLALFAAALFQVGWDVDEVRKSFNRLKETWTDKALTNLHRSIW